MENKELIKDCTAIFFREQDADQFIKDYAVSLSKFIKDYAVSWSKIEIKLYGQKFFAVVDRQ
jgi:hypothetical protein